MVMRANILLMSALFSGTLHVGVGVVVGVGVGVECRGGWVCWEAVEDGGISHVYGS